MTRDVPRCPRCLVPHPALAFEPLERPIIGYREWAPCPNGKGPILAAPSFTLVNVIRHLGKTAQQQPDHA